MLKIFILLFAFVCTLIACKKPDDSVDKPIEDKSAFDIAPQRAQLQKAKELEKKMQQDAASQRKIIEYQINQ